MAAPKNPLMKSRHFLLRVFSVKQDRGGPEVHEPVPRMWEVRADAEAGMEQASLFYHESNPRNLPPLDSLIHVTIDDQLTAEVDTRHEAAQRHGLAPIQEDPKLYTTVTDVLPDHVHTHNGFEDCLKYATCKKGCHCHLQDERHTACCKGAAARELYARDVARAAVTPDSTPTE